MNNKNRLFLIFGGIGIFILIVGIFVYIKSGSSTSTDSGVQDISKEQQKSDQNKEIINQVTDMNSKDINTGAVSDFLKQENTAYYNECLNAGDKNMIKACIEQKEKAVVEKMGEYTLDSCKQLVFYKDRCLNLLYYKKAKEDMNVKFCDYIKDKSMNELCQKNVSQIAERDNSRKALLQKEDEKIKTSLAYIESSTSISSCNSLNGDLKIKCIYKFVNQDKDLRYCNNGLDKTKSNMCINNNWVEVVSYNLAKVKQTKDKTYCDKIYISQRKSKCLNEIK